MTNTHSKDLSKIKQVKKDGRKGGNRKPATNKQFLAKAQKVHGDRFCYKKTLYAHSAKKVTITCKLHGDFEQVAERHLRSKHGCRECAKISGIKTSTKSTAQFVSKVKKIHENKYDYSKTKYVGCTGAIIITCSEHGDFERTAATHLLGYGCNKCSGVKDRVRTIDDFIERAKEVHGEGKYDYSKSVYKNAQEKIVIICPTHGVFKQMPSGHLQGNGCRACAIDLTGGYSRSDFKRLCDKNQSGNGTLYVIRCYNDDEAFYKVGITSNDLRTRFESKREMPYSFDEVYSIDGEAGYIYDLEVRLHSLLKLYSYKPVISFRGYTECFTKIKPIERLLKTLSSDAQMQLIA